MNKLIKFFQTALSYLLYKWFVVLIDIIKRLCNKIKKQIKDKKDKGRRERRETKANCVPINSPVYYKPDPMIYSQSYLMKQGLAVTWDNPDIQLFAGNTPISSEALKPDTEYTIQARIWNASHEAPVVGMPVRFSFLSFGAGTTSKHIDDTMISLGIIGGSNNPNFAKVKWRTPATQGHYCIQVKLDWADDKNPENNLGQENTNVVQAHSPANFTFKVKNTDKKAHKYHFEVDTYTLPEQIVCEELPRDKKRRLEITKNRHRRTLFPIPAGWNIDFNPEFFGLSSQEEIEISAEITPPEDFKGKQPFNINAFNELNILTGGVTVYIEKL